MSADSVLRRIGAAKSAFDRTALPGGMMQAAPGPARRLRPPPAPLLSPPHDDREVSPDLSDTDRRWHLPPRGSLPSPSLGHVDDEGIKRREYDEAVGVVSSTAQSSPSTSTTSCEPAVVEATPEVPHSFPLSGRGHEHRYPGLSRSRSRSPREALVIPNSAQPSSTQSPHGLIDSSRNQTQLEAVPRTRGELSVSPAPVRPSAPDEDGQGLLPYSIPHGLGASPAPLFASSSNALSGAAISDATMKGAVVDEQDRRRRAKDAASPILARYPELSKRTIGGRERSMDRTVKRSALHAALGDRALRRAIIEGTVDVSSLLPSPSGGVRRSGSVPPPAPASGTCTDVETENEGHDDDGAQQSGFVHGEEKVTYAVNNDQLSSSRPLQEAPPSHEGTRRSSPIHVSDADPRAAETAVSRRGHIAAPLPDPGLPRLQRIHGPPAVNVTKESTAPKEHDEPLPLPGDSVVLPSTTVVSTRDEPSRHAVPDREQLVRERSRTLDASPLPKHRSVSEAHSEATVTVGVAAPPDLTVLMSATETNSAASSRRGEVEHRARRAHHDPLSSSAPSVQNTPPTKRRVSDDAVETMTASSTVGRRTTGRRGHRGALDDSSNAFTPPHRDASMLEHDTPAALPNPLRSLIAASAVKASPSSVRSPMGAFHTNTPHRPLVVDGPSPHIFERQALFPQQQDVMREQRPRMNHHDAVPVRAADSDSNSEGCTPPRRAGDSGHDDQPADESAVSHCFVFEGEQSGVGPSVEDRTPHARGSADESTWVEDSSLQFVPEGSSCVPGTALSFATMQQDMTRGSVPSHMDPPEDTYHEDPTESTLDDQSPIPRRPSLAQETSPLLGPGLSPLGISCATPSLLTSADCSGAAMAEGGDLATGLASPGVAFTTDQNNISGRREEVRRGASLAQSVEQRLLSVLDDEERSLLKGHAKVSAGPTTEARATTRKDTAPSQGLRRAPAVATGGPRKVGYLARHLARTGDKANRTPSAQAAQELPVPREGQGGPAGESLFYSRGGVKPGRPQRDWEPSLTFLDSSLYDEAITKTHAV